MDRNVSEVESIIMVLLNRCFFCQQENTRGKYHLIDEFYESRHVLDAKPSIWVCYGCNLVAKDRTLQPCPCGKEAKGVITIDWGHDMYVIYRSLCAEHLDRFGKIWTNFFEKELES